MAENELKPESQNSAAGPPPPPPQLTEQKKQADQDPDRQKKSEGQKAAPQKRAADRKKAADNTNRGARPVHKPEEKNISPPEEDDLVSSVGRSMAYGIGGFFRAVWFVIKGLLLGIAYALRGLVFGIIKLVRLPFHTLQEDILYADDVETKINKSKKKGKEAYNKALLGGGLHLLFGERGSIKRLFTALLPVLSVVFLIGVINYGRTVNYAMVVECNGTRIGVVADEAIYKEGVRLARDRVQGESETDMLKISSKYRLMMFNSSDSFLTAGTLADNIIKASAAEVTEASGIYVAGKFIGAVDDPVTVSNALAENLSDYQIIGSAAYDIKYRDDVSYKEGLYLSSTVVTPQQMISKLLSKTEEKSLHFARAGETLTLIAADYGMDYDKIAELNPGLTSNSQLHDGETVYVIKETHFLPIQYTRVLTETAYTDYDTVQVGTPTLEVGQTAILVKGQRGEKLNTVRIVYVDGVQSTREITKTQVISKPVTEEIGVGTFIAAPLSGSVALNGTGKFMWPVNGGYISDGFMEGRVHKGMDIAANAGTDIYAAASGTVIASGWNAGGYGYMILIDHGNGYQTLYAHCSGLVVKTGDLVLKGQLIGQVGSTGDSTGNHLHFEVRYNNVCYNPANFINTGRSGGGEETEEEEY